jgi:hypothetical protein
MDYKLEFTFCDYCYYTLTMNDVIFYYKKPHYSNKYIVISEEEFSCAKQDCVEDAEGLGGMAILTLFVFAICYWIFHGLKATIN